MGPHFRLGETNGKIGTPCQQALRPSCNPLPREGRDITGADSTGALSRMMSS